MVEKRCKIFPHQRLYTLSCKYYFNAANIPLNSYAKISNFLYSETLSPIISHVISEPTNS